jgi:hypothetical protein
MQERILDNYLIDIRKNLIDDDQIQLVCLLHDPFITSNIIHISWYSIT